jgi:hypothetical protein
VASIIEIYRRLVVRSGDASQLDYGSITTPQNPTAATGVPVAQPKTITLAAGAGATLWDWTVDGDFSVMLIECDGFVWIEQTVDAPTASDGSNNAAAGTATNRPKEGLSCVGPLVIQGMAVPVVPTSGGHQDNYAASFHASTTNGRRYKIVAKNPASATTSVKVTCMWAK